MRNDERSPKSDDRLLFDLAAAAREAITFDGSDPELTLALVIWPTERVLEAKRTATGRVRRETWDVDRRRA